MGLPLQWDTLGSLWLECSAVPKAPFCALARIKPSPEFQPTGKATSEGAKGTGKPELCPGGQPVPDGLGMDRGRYSGSPHEGNLLGRDNHSFPSSPVTAVHPISSNSLFTFFHCQHEAPLRVTRMAPLSCDLKQDNLWLVLNGPRSDLWVELPEGPHPGLTRLRETRSITLIV